ncbi:MAG TPA: T9SS type A sorting domain-containing protein [Puia sp.]|nr:T9SS type A sorting domain-containing protein [Puia sp.]
MKKDLLCISVGLSLCSLLYGVNASAQIKGDPAFSGVTLQQTGPKTPSILSPDLKNLHAAYQTKKTKAPQAVAKPTPGTGMDYFDKYMQIKGDKVVIDVTAKEDLTTAKAELQKLGATITATYGRVISAVIPIASLPQLESATSIRFARPAYKPQHVKQNALNASRTSIQRPAFDAGDASYYFAPKKITPVISQGDTAQLSYLARKQYKVDGKGVKVGVLSDSYNNLGTANTGVAHGELPGATNPFNYKKPVQVLSDLDSGGTDEGRAMLEIIHDVAPGSELAFHTADNGQADFANGILQLAHQGCSVIADDVFYYAEPFFQDGIIAQAIVQVKKEGVTYFSSAGNSSIRSYESPYRPTPVRPLDSIAGTAHNFSGPSDPPRYFQPVYIPSGGTLISSFQWDQSSFSASGVGATTDFDIYLLDSDGNIVAVGGSDNIASGDPIEVFGYFNNTTNVTFYLLILKYAGPDPTRLKYNLYGDALFYLTNPAIPGILSPSLVGHTKAEGAISTGAAFYLQTPPYAADTPIVEGFSSVGGVANYYDIEGNRIAPLIRKKPDIVAPDGGNTSFFDPFGNGDITQDTDTFPNFFGTSAAAPHAAGVAALMIDAQKLNTITPSQIKGILSTHTWDMDNPYTTGFDKGFDYATGYGLIKATGAVGEVKFPNSYVKNLQLTPLCSADPKLTRNWKISNPNPFDVPVTWLVSGTNERGSLVVPPGDTTFSTKPLYLHGFPLPEIAIIDWEDNFLFPHLDLAYSTSAVCGKDKVSAANSDQSLNGVAKTLQNGKPALTEVYPNPSDGLFKLYLSAEQQNVTLSLYSADGKQLMTRRAPGAMGVIDIDATSYRPGVYFLKVIQGNDVKTIKLIRK